MDKRIKILIDNGHGAETPGKRSPDGRLPEYRYSREIAAEILKELRKRGIDAILLVPEERDVALSERVRRVNSYCSSQGTSNVILLSIHCNAAPPNDGKWHKARGWSAWTSPGRTGSDLLAEYLYKSAASVLPSAIPIRRDLSDGDSDWEANFTILTKTRCVAVLTENLFQDNKEDVDYLLSDSGRSAIINLHVNGLTSYLQHRG